jgi:hypothetical protein
MSKHSVIIITPPPGGGNLVASGGTNITIEWRPDPDLTPAQERRRTEWAEKQAEKIVERLDSPAGGEAHVE